MRNFHSLARSKRRTVLSSLIIFAGRGIGILLPEARRSTGAGVSARDNAHRKDIRQDREVVGDKASDV